MQRQIKDDKIEIDRLYERVEQMRNQLNSINGGGHNAVPPLPERYFQPPPPLDTEFEDDPKGLGLDVDGNNDADEDSMDEA